MTHDDDDPLFSRAQPEIGPTTTPRQCRRVNVQCGTGSSLIASDGSVHAVPTTPKTRAPRFAASFDGQPNLCRVDIHVGMKKGGLFRPA
jgi:hypothetical protein